MAGTITKVKVEGLSDFKTALEELPKATGTNVQKRVLNSAGDPIQQTAEALTRVRTGRLQRSVVVSSKLSRTQRQQLEKLSRIEVYVGPGALVQAITEEFGTVHESAHPFMRPAWDANKKKALDIIKEELGVEIEKAVQRLARKAARLAAQMGR